MPGMGRGALPVPGRGIGCHSERVHAMALGTRMVYMVYMAPVLPARLPLPACPWPRACLRTNTVGYEHAYHPPLIKDYSLTGKRVSTMPESSYTESTLDLSFILLKD